MNFSIVIYQNGKGLADTFQVCMIRDIYRTDFIYLTDVYVKVLWKVKQLVGTFCACMKHVIYQSDLSQKTWRMKIPGLQILFCEYSL
jgi:hypothetical protein